MPIPDLSGLLGGLGQGMQAYNQARIQSQQMGLLQQQHKAALAEKGYVLDENGNVVPGELVAKQQDYAKQGLDPTSQISKDKRELARGLLKSSNPNLKDEDVQKYVPDTMPGYEVDNAGLLKTGVQGGYGYQGAQAKALPFIERNKIQREGLDLRKEAQGQKAGDVIDKDPVIKTATIQQNKIRNGMHTLDTVGTLTPEITAEIQSDIAAAIAQGGSSAEGEQRKKEFNSLSQEYAKLSEHLSSTPQDINNPELKKYLHDVMGRLDEAYSRNMADRAKTIGGGRVFNHGSMTEKAMNAKVKQYTQPTQQQAPAGLLQQPNNMSSAQAAPMTPDDQQAIQWAQSNPNDPRAAKILQLHGGQ